MVGTQTRKRNVDPAMFANAIRYHDGGLPGLKADEVPTILQKGEEVTYFPDTYKVSLVVDGEQGAGYARTEPCVT